MRVLVLGLGSIGMRHAGNLLSLGHEVIGYDTNEAAAEAAEGMGVKIIDPAAMFDDYELKACVIATPTISHDADMSFAALAGMHMLVEKPIAERPSITLGRALERANKKKLVVMVGNMLRFHPNVKTAKRLIDRPISATFWVLQKNSRPQYLRDGVIRNWGAHEIDLALHLLGPAKLTYAESTPQEDKATIKLKHDSGVETIIHMDYLTDPEVRRFEVDEINLMTHNVNLTLHSWDKIYLEEMQAFIDRIEGKETLGATARDGVATLAIIDDARKKAGLK